VEKNKIKLALKIAVDIRTLIIANYDVNHHTIYETIYNQLVVV